MNNNLTLILTLRYKYGKSVIAGLQQRSTIIVTYHACIDRFMYTSTRFSGVRSYRAVAALFVHVSDPPPLVGGQRDVLGVPLTLTGEELTVAHVTNRQSTYNIQKINIPRTNN